MFAAASAAVSISTLPVGIFHDRYGPSVSSTTGGLLLTIGAAFLGLAHRMSHDGFICGFLCLALGGQFVYHATEHLPNAFPEQSDLLFTLQTCAYNASSAIFLVFRLLNEITVGWLSTQRFFVAYLAVPVFILLVEVFLMPKAPYMSISEFLAEVDALTAADFYHRVDESMPDREEAERQHQERWAQRQNRIRQIQEFLDDWTEGLSKTRAALLESPDSGDLTTSNQRVGRHAASATSPWFTLMALFTMTEILLLNYFLASHAQQYETLHSIDAASQLNDAFDFLFPIGGVISVPLIKIFLTKSSIRSTVLTLMIGATTMAAIGCIPTAPAGYITILLYVIYRPFFLASVSNYTVKIFGSRSSALLPTILISISGLGNFLQPAIDTLTFKVFHRSPIPVNIILTAMTAIAGTALVVYIWPRSRILDMSNQDEESRPVDGDGVNAEGIEPGEQQPLLRSRKGKQPIYTNELTAGSEGVGRNQENIPPSGEPSVQVPSRGGGLSSK